ncbi:hypothetical protein Forpe1208_v011271 [Fusarium oxysporum f. sp. rapae]|uniref:Glycoside hydrolase family 5 domain-containing protein n=1 Tax=Fusarium oxysporum f. sp. rapae TaxID=485398 RepID=A0A8J5U4A4_FUSOX|nr:hypothetical protein Forpe1208_v011271 [Fusarium oxysporum f. sp. rapae]
MKFSSLTRLMLCLFSVATTNATKSFSASNLYYAAGLTDGQQTTLLNGLKSAGVKVLRAHDYGIKLLVSIHTYNALKKNSDFYRKWCGTGDFYTNSKAISHFKDRIAHVLAHKHTKTGKTWAQSTEYIFAFEALNEAMHPQRNPQALTSWQCTMAKSIKYNLNGNSKILVTTGGGAYLDNSLLDAYFTCDSLDVLAIHAYGVADLTTSRLQPFVDKAKKAGKKLIMQEWVPKWAANIDAAGIPWFYWQILPNADPHQGWDYEVGIKDANWDTLKAAGLAAGKAESAFDFSPYLL